MAEISEQSFWRRLSSSPLWSACKTGAAIISFVVGLPAAWIAFDQARNAKDAAASAQTGAELARRSIEALEKQVALANQQAQSLKASAEAAQEAARQSQRLAESAEKSATTARQQVDVLERQANIMTRARIEISKLEGRFAVGQFPAQFISVRKMGLGQVTNIRLFAAAEIVDRNQRPSSLKSCEGSGVGDVLALEDKYYRELQVNLSQEDYDQVRSGRKKFVVYGGFCYNDETQKDLITHFCGETSLDYGPSHCRDFPS